MAREPVEPATDCLALTPEPGVLARQAGIRRLAHQPGAAWSGGAGSGALRLEAGVPWHRDDFEALTGAWGLPLLGDWSVEAGPPLRLVPPPGMEGAVVAVEGTGPAGAAERHLLAVGAAGEQNLGAWTYAYAPFRRRLQPPPRLEDAQGPVSADAVEVDLAALLADDVDADGNPEILVFAVFRGRDLAGQAAGEGSELGVVWGGGAVSLVPLAFESELYRIPPAMNRGRPALLELSRCCGAVWGRVWELGTVATAEPMVRAGEGDALCLRPGEGERAAGLLRWRP